VKEKEFFRMMLEPTDNVMFIVNTDGVIVSSNYEEYIGNDLNSMDGMQEIYESEQGSFEREINQERKIITFKSYSEDNKSEKQWKIIMLASFDDQDKMIASFAQRGILISSLCFLGMVIVIFLFSESISRRIKRLVKQTERIVMQDYNIPVNDDGEDELGQLADSFNKMQKHLHVLINEVYEQKIKMQSSQLKQKEAEFLALQNQINPHFLYNTLDAIRMEAVINKDESTAEMIMSLSAMLRYNTSRGNPVVKLRDELANLTNYIRLMNMKYDNTICFQDSVPIELYDCDIVKFIFQPIAENSFKHGNITVSENAMIKITGRFTDGNIEIEIEDNGIGIEDGSLVKLNEMLSNCISRTTSIGLRNVNQRIRFNCGETYGLQVESKLGYGTTVKILLPYVNEVEENAEGIIGG
jgi:two-component system sensor histidine kinase YesM